METNETPILPAGTEAAPASPAPQKQSRFAKFVVGTGLAAGLALGVGAIASAQTDPPADPPSTQAPSGDEAQKAPDGNGPRGKFGGPGRHGMRGHKMGMGMGIHGEFVVPKGDGTYQTLASQKGTVTAVSATSITVLSEDGFSRTYVVDDNTVVRAGDEGIADVAKDDKVHVLAVVTGSTAKAVQIGDATAVQKRHESWAPKRPAPAPGADANATTSS